MLGCFQVLKVKAWHGAHCLSWGGQAVGCLPPTLTPVAAAAHHPLPRGGVSWGLPPASQDSSGQLLLRGWHGETQGQGGRGCEAVVKPPRAAGCMDTALPCRGGKVHRNSSELWCYFCFLSCLGVTGRCFHARSIQVAVP